MYRMDSEVCPVGGWHTVRGVGPQRGSSKTGVGNCEPVGVTVTVGVGEGVGVSVRVGVLVAVAVGVRVDVNVRVGICVGVSVIVGVGLRVGVSVGVDVSVMVAVAVRVGGGVGVGGVGLPSSKAPMSHDVPKGRVRPRWSVVSAAPRLLETVQSKD